MECDDYPCKESCPVEAISIDQKTTAVIVDKDKCIGCGACTKACSGSVPYLHPRDRKANICDLCGGDPECVKVCQEAGYNALKLVHERMNNNRKLYSRDPVKVAKKLAVKMFGEKGLEVIE